MEIESLPPGMENLDDGRSSAKVFFITGKLKKNLSGAFVHERVKGLLIGKDKGFKLSGQSENDMKIRHVKDFCSAGVDPDFFEYSLTVGAVAIAAGIVMKFNMTTVGTETDITSERAGLTVHNGKSHFGLDNGGIKGVGISFPAIIKNLLNLKPVHESLL